MSGQPACFLEGERHHLMIIISGLGEGYSNQFDYAKVTFHIHPMTYLDLFTLKSSSQNIVCYFHTFENNLGMKLYFSI